MRKFLLFLIFGATLAHGQVVTGTCSISLPANVTFDTVTAKQLILTGGTAYPDGNYLASFKGGALTFTQYVPPVPSGGTSVPGKSYTLPVPALAGWAQGWYQVKGAVLAAGQIAFATPTFTGQPPASMLYLTDTVWADTTGQVWIRIGNGTGNAFPAMNWSITVK